MEASEMTCGIVRLICEEPLIPPPDLEGVPTVVDVEPKDVARMVATLQQQGWQYISEWHL